MKLKVKLIKRLCIIGIISILLTAVFSTAAFWYMFSDRTKEELCNYGTVLSASLNQNTKNTDLSIYKSDSYRLTLIDKDGKVLYESNENARQNQMGNHSDRPEFIEAKEKGTAESYRNSNTLGGVTYYYAQRLDNGNILRVSKEVDGIFSMFVIFIPVVIAIAFYVFIVCFIIAARFTKNIVKPIEKMTTEGAAGELYEELIPFAKTFEMQKREINSQVEKVQAERDKIRAIIANMAEGFIMLDTDKNILMENESAKKFLNAKGDNIIGKNILEVCNDDKLLNCISAAIHGNSVTEESKTKKGSIQFIVNPVYSTGEQIGVICLIMDISHRKKTEKLRREFTANVSHELKTPLTSISGYAEMIENGMAKEEDIKLFAGKIHKEAGRLVSLISDIINLSKLDEAVITNENKEKVNLKKLVEESTEALEASAEKHGITMEIDAEDCIVLGVNTRLYELIYNLCDNAIRYNKKGGTVKISVHKEDNKAVLKVQDTGIGIAQKHVKRIFERFYRVDKSRSKETGGTGLGLAIVKHVAEQHNAKITVDSQQGAGTCITVKFDLA